MSNMISPLRIACRLACRLFVAVPSAAFLWVVVSSSQLRPSGDDYCFGENVARCGAFSGVIEWWNTWSGFASAMLFGNVLVGFSLAALSFDIASSIPFVMATLTVALSFLFISGQQHDSWIDAISWVAVISCAWWGYLWLPYSWHLSTGDLRLMAVGLTHWQTINGTYVVQMTVFMMLSAACISTMRTRPKWAPVLAVIMGLEAGFGGPALAISTVMTVGLIALLRLKQRPFKTAHMTVATTFSVICVMAALASVKLSPGCVYRSSYFSNHASLSLEGIWEIVRFTVVFSVKKWCFTLINIGAISSGVIVMATSLLINGRRANPPRNRPYLIWSAYLCLFSLVQCFVNRLSEYFTYSGYWHYASAHLCSFMSIMLFSMWLAERVPPLLVARRARLLFMLFTLTAFAANVSALHEMVQSMSDRKIAWQAGPATLPGLSDIDDHDGWQMGCWKALASHRRSMDPPGFRLPAD